MARTWDTPSTHTTNTAFTTARSWSHTVGGGSNRYIWCGISTEDFSTGGGAQTPSSVAYGGNALTLDSIATVSSVQTAALYSGQDSVCGTAGAHNMVVTYSGEVNAIVAWAVSTDNVAQQVKEATGSVVQSTSVSNGTSNITTLTAESLIIAVAGDDEGTAGSGGTVGHSWNVGTEFGDLSNASVGGSMVRYEKATAGAQAMTDTLSESVSRLCMVSAAYETINNTPPVNTVPGTQAFPFGANPVSGVSVADTENIVTVRIQTSDGGQCVVELSGSVTIISGANGTDDFTLGTAASNSEMNTVLATLQTVLTQVPWTDETMPPPPGHISASTTITITSDDGTATDADDIVCNYTIATGDGTLSLLLSNASVAGINAETDLAHYIPEPEFVGTTYLYALLLDGNGNNDEVIIEVIVTGVAIPLLYQQLHAKRRGVI